MNILEKIVATKKIEVEKLRQIGEKRLSEEAIDTNQPRGFLDHLQKGSGIKIIAEIKKASPSAGIIRSTFDPATIALSYAEHGASCLSVLTDNNYFKGSLFDLKTARDSVSIPILRKDFIIDRLQVFEARAAGADAILLIAEILNQNQMQELHHLSISLGMDVLVEIHDPECVDKALSVGAQLIGINNRDLRTFSTDLNHSLRIRTLLPEECFVVSESGIKTKEDLDVLWNAGVNGVLIGETFMRAEDPGQKLSWLLGRQLE
jgi:indole-3-glycerol phosphate synthase